MEVLDVLWRVLMIIVVCRHLLRRILGRICEELKTCRDEHSVKSKARLTRHIVIVIYRRSHKPPSIWPS